MSSFLMAASPPYAFYEHVYIIQQNGTVFKTGPQMGEFAPNSQTILAGSSSEAFQSAY
jgi:hypothetical protein